MRQFIDLYPTDMDESTRRDLSLRRMFCDFLCASLQITQARFEDEIDIKLQHYGSVRTHVEAFRNQISNHLSRLEGGARDDLEKKYVTLVVFDFEAAAQLKRWDDLEELVDFYTNPLPSPADPAASPKDPAASPMMLTMTTTTMTTTTTMMIRVYEAMADIVLCSTSNRNGKSGACPTAIALTILHKLIFKTRAISPTPTAKLTRWLRIVMQLALPSYPDLTSSVLDNAVSLARQSHLDVPQQRQPSSYNDIPQLQSEKVQEDYAENAKYPPDELEYMTTTAFNHAIDIYNAGIDAVRNDAAGTNAGGRKANDADIAVAAVVDDHDTMVRSWAERALALAACMDDGGAMQRELQERYVALRLGDV
ncbi:MAG: hypothetical protein M1825_001128 [Sarcosagium campestre]|nr:MAG: hypothetical protein M1825_001128 [Sarcosagium campestre]